MSSLLLSFFLVTFLPANQRILFPTSYRYFSGTVLRRSGSCWLVVLRTIRTVCNPFPRLTPVPHRRLAAADAGGNARLARLPGSLDKRNNLTRTRTNPRTSMMAPLRSIPLGQKIREKSSATLNSSTKQSTSLNKHIRPLLPGGNRRIECRRRRRVEEEKNMTEGCAALTKSVSRSPLCSAFHIFFIIYKNNEDTTGCTIVAVSNTWVVQE